jgi:hypothetical protein
MRRLAVPAPQTLLAEIVTRKLPEKIGVPEMRPVGDLIIERDLFRACNRE